VLLRPVFLTLKPLVPRLPPIPSTPHYIGAILLDPLCSLLFGIISSFKNECLHTK
jgi:hypothetical protein